MRQKPSSDRRGRMQPRPEPPMLVTVEEAARRLSIGRTAAYMLVLSGELQSVKIGRTRRVVVASLEAYIQRLLREEGANGDLVKQEGLVR